MPATFPPARLRARASAATAAAISRITGRSCRVWDLPIRPTDRLVVRGGYGATSFYEGNSSNQRLTSITPFIQAVNVTVITPTPGNP